MSEELLKALVTIVGGALAGGLTNTVAIWMLFHPIEPPAVLGRSIRMLQGAIPKNQPRLARAIGSTVGNRLLTPEDLARTFGRTEFREAFDQKLATFLSRALEAEHPSIREMLGPESAAKAEQVVSEALDHLLPLLQDYLASDAFESAVQSRAGKLADLLGDASAGDLLTAERRAEIESSATKWMSRAVAGDHFRQVVDEYVRKGAEKLLTSEKPLREVLPPGTGAVVEKTVAGYLPLAVRRLGAMLESPKIRESLQAAVHDVLKRVVQDLKLHQRMVARWVIKGDTVEKIFDAIEADGVDRLANLLREPPAQKALETGIRDAVTDLLDQPLNQLLPDPEDPAWSSAVDAVANQVVELARSEATRSFAAEKLAKFLDHASERTWGELAGRLPRAQVAAWVVDAARSELAGTVYGESAKRLAAVVLHRPIGRPARLLPPALVDRLRSAAADPMWSWLQGQVPEVVAKLDVAQRVEEKVAEFPVETMEALVRRVTERELRMIVRLGYALGLFVGLLLVVVNRLWN